MEHVESVMNPVQGKIGAEIAILKDLKVTLKIGLAEIKILTNLFNNHKLTLYIVKKCLEWIPFEKFQGVKYITRGGFGKIYSATWSEGYIRSWDIENKKWDRESVKVALKSIDNSSDINKDFLNEVIKIIEYFILSLYLSCVCT